MYISGELFQHSCKWNLDSRYPLRVWSESELLEGDTVFLKFSDIPNFINLSPSKKVNLLIHNSDETFTDKEYDILEPFVIEVKTVNCNSDRATKIPLGFRDDQYTSHTVLDEIKNEGVVERDILCLANFLISTNPQERKKAYNYFKQTMFSEVDDEYASFPLALSLIHSHPTIQEMRKRFYRMLKRSRFVICPPGTGVDTHRIYEALFFGAIPIVKTSFLDSLYRQFPIIIVKNWEDVTKEFLSRSITFVTYGNELFKNSRERILKEAIESEIFKNCIAYTPNELEHDFKEQCKVLLSQRRGGGYWCWRAYLLLKTMETLKEGEWILYADAGCLLVPNRKNQVFEQIEEMEKSGKMVSAYQMCHPEKTWTKADLAVYLNALNDKEIMDTGQYIGGVFLIKNTERIRELLEKIKSIMIIHPHLIDDSPSIVKNDDTFQEHRHDQSLFSILRKQNKDITYVIPTDETYYGNAFVQAMRIRT